MDQIYKHYTTLIVSTAGSDSSFGQSGVTSTARISQRTVTTQGVTLCSTLPNPVYTTRRSTWMTRGCTYKEAIFPKRLVYFTDRQVVFECNATLFTEVFNHPADVKVQQCQHDDSISVATDISKFNDPLMPCMAISSHIEAFSSRNVTYEVDALNQRWAQSCDNGLCDVVFIQIAAFSPYRLAIKRHLNMKMSLIVEMNQTPILN
jgi:hypothetical protein